MLKTYIVSINMYTLTFIAIEVRCNIFARII